MKEINIDFRENLIKIEGETDPVAIQQIIQDAGYTPIPYSIKK